jgi:hypothetical protein
MLRIKASGDSVNIKVKNVMEKLLIYDLATQFSWTGCKLVRNTAPPKMSFSSNFVNFINFICAAMESENPKEVRKGLQDYFKRAPLRLTKSIK